MTNEISACVRADVSFSATFRKKKYTFINIILLHFATLKENKCFLKCTKVKKKKNTSNYINGTT